MPIKSLFKQSKSNSLSHAQVPKHPSIKTDQVHLEHKLSPRLYPSRWPPWPTHRNARFRHDRHGHAPNAIQPDPSNGEHIPQSIDQSIRPEGPNRNSAASLDRGRRCLTPIYGEIQINSDQKFYRAQRRNYYVWDLVRKSL